MPHIELQGVRVEVSDRMLLVLLLSLDHLIVSLLNLQLLFDSPELCELPPLHQLSEMFARAC